MKGISVYIVSGESQAALNKESRPKFTNFLGDHVTYQFKSSDSDPLPPTGDYYVVGYAYEMERHLRGSGIEAWVVEINGSTTRPDGETYHITWSHGSGHAPKDSKRIVKKGWTKLDNPIKIHMEPAFIPFN